MSDYTIGTYSFVRWEGPRPQFVRQNVLEFRKPGQNGISAQLQGINGQPFQTTLTAVFTTEALARVDESSYRNLIGTVQVLTYEATNYYTTYQTQYLIHDVSVSSAKAHPRLIGPTYDHSGGWAVISQWTLIPIAM